MVVNINGKQTGSAGGLSSQQKLQESFDDLYLTYTVKIGVDFDFSSYLNDGSFSTLCHTDKRNCTLNTGKLLGLSGGDTTTNSGGIDDTKDPNRGWSVRLNWREGGEAGLYVYHMNQGDKNSDPDKDEFGDDFKFNLKPVILKLGQSYTVTLHVVMNSIGQQNGLLEAWVNGEAVAHYSDLEFRSEQLKSGNIQNLMFSAFIGGSGARYQHQHDEQLSFSHIALHTTYNLNYPDIFKSSCLFELTGRHCNNYFTPTLNMDNSEFEGFVYRTYQTNFVGTQQDNVFMVGRDFPETLQVGKVDDIIELLRANAIAGCQ
ncbi:MAG: hypothetical protein Q7U38_03125 [Methylobacter sp.]|nr:hypothetical protein [Methylobacter sp.]MDP2429764.1 hypothetical protein [Methylobacter sp.]MDP3056566.1 hypothetical protein [Methylobacter sp.]MDP3364180.1 hypothetical protein [Methylobacter sp.]MDZ4217962.1 hypothetical protein [Methylobacter sp.]